MKILSLNGALGYGYPEESLMSALEQGVDLVGADAGSTDPGPYYLGSGNTTFSKDSFKRDLKIALLQTIKHKIPFVIGTAAVSGANPHLMFMKNIIEEIASEEKLTFKMAIIHSDISKEYLIEKIRQGKVRGFTDQINLSENDVMKMSNIVGQIGTEAFIKALDAGCDVILAGRACDTSIFASLPILKGYDPGLCFHMAKIIECGAMCAIPMKASDCILAEISENDFILTPPNKALKCTMDRVIAHSMYEQSSPFKIVDPEGYTNLTDSKYYQHDERSVRVTGSKFYESKQKTIKVEASSLVGYRTISIGGVNDMMIVNKVDDIISHAQNIADNMLAELYSKDDYSINFKIIGGTIDGTTISTAIYNMGIIIDVVAKTQEMSKSICTTVKSIMLHYDYPGRKATTGNVATPYSPSEIAVGPVYRFSAYHLISVDDFSETYQIEYVTVGEDNG